MSSVSSVSRGELGEVSSTRVKRVKAGKRMGRNGDSKNVGFRKERRTDIVERRNISLVQVDRSADHEVRRRKEREEGGDPERDK